jgi:hypothetical protein
MPSQLCGHAESERFDLCHSDGESLFQNVTRLPNESLGKLDRSVGGAVLNMHSTPSNNHLFTRMAQTYKSYPPQSAFK